MRHLSMAVVMLLTMGQERKQKTACSDNC